MKAFWQVARLLAHTAHIKNPTSLSSYSMTQLSFGYPAEHGTKLWFTTRIDEIAWKMMDQYTKDHITLCRQAILKHAHDLGDRQLCKKNCDIISFDSTRWKTLRSSLFTKVLCGTWPPSRAAAWWRADNLHPRGRRLGRCPPSPRRHPKEISNLTQWLNFSMTIKAYKII